MIMVRRETIDNRDRINDQGVQEKAVPKGKFAGFWLWAFIVLNVAFLGFLFSRLLSEYPIGWDSPYYIANTRYFEEQGLAGSRSSFVALMAAGHLVLGIPLLQLHILFPIAVAVLLAFGMGILVSRLFGNQPWVLALTFFLTLWHPNTFFLTISTFDNALGLTLVTFALVFLSGKQYIAQRAAAFFLLSSMLVVTHFESYLFLLFVVAVYSLLFLINSRSLPLVWRALRWFVLPLAATAVFAAFQWLPLLQKIYAQYTTITNVTENASIPFAEQQDVFGFFLYAKTGLTNGVDLILFLVGTFSLIGIVRTARKNKMQSLLLLAYAGVAYIVLLYSVLRSSIPINRAILLLPITVLISIGFVNILHWLRRQVVPRRTVLISILLVFAVLPIPRYFNVMKRLAPAIHRSTFRGLQTLGGYLERTKTNSAVIIGNTPPDVRAASAYYGLWTNWLSAVFPLPHSERNYCVYFGNVDQLLAGISTHREANDEYNETSKESLRCLDRLPQKSSPMFIIRDMYPGTYPPTIVGATVRTISSDVVEVVPTADQSALPGNPQAP